jgi:hypothetical protein
MPDSTTPITRAPKSTAAERNSASTDGRCPVLARASRQTHASLVDEQVTVRRSHMNVAFGERLVVLGGLRRQRPRVCQDARQHARDAS